MAQGATFSFNLLAGESYSIDDQSGLAACTIVNNSTSSGNIYFTGTTWLFINDVSESSQPVEIAPGDALDLQFDANFQGLTFSITVDSGTTGIFIGIK